VGVGKSHLAGVWAGETAAVRLAADTPTAGFPPRGIAVLVEDADRGAADATLFHLIERAQRGEGALLLTGRAAPSGWPCALPDLRSRLNALAVAELAQPDDALFVALLRKFFRERSARPSPELLRWLARRVERSAEAAREVVARLDEASAHGRIGLALARAVLGEGPGPDPGREAPAS
jgi:chromosomal replication initiation ATPase DnaA